MRTDRPDGNRVLQREAQDGRLLRFRCALEMLERSADQLAQHVDIDVRHAFDVQTRLACRVFAEPGEQCVVVSKPRLTYRVRFALRGEKPVRNQSPSGPLS